LSLAKIAEFLDGLSDNNLAFLKEGETNVVVSRLDYENALRLLSLAQPLGVAESAFDSSNNEWRLHELTEDNYNLRINVKKPTCSEGICRFLTKTGFKNWLLEKKNEFPLRCEVLNLQRPFRTWATIYSGWEDENFAGFERRAERKSPLLLVKEQSSERSVPIDIRPWVLCQGEVIKCSDPIAATWASVAACEILRALSEEAEAGQVRFKGPPRTDLVLPKEDGDFFLRLGGETFGNLQLVAQWVFEDTASTETRHLLFAKEFARAGHPSSTVDYVQQNITTGYESAKIAYQLSLSDVGRDTIEILADLRKAVTEESAKIADITRQFIAALTGSLSIGVGLIAARIIVGADPFLLVLIMIVIVLYMSIIIYSSSQFIRIQETTRGQWYPILYRFLPDDQYRKNVTGPIESFESTYRRSRGLAVAALIVLASAASYSFFRAAGDVVNVEDQAGASRINIVDPALIGREQGDLSKPDTPEEPARASKPQGPVVEDTAGKENGEAEAFSPPLPPPPKIP
jgi:hypothetical protein